jgi:hypothetical protein
MFARSVDDDSGNSFFRDLNDVCVMFVTLVASYLMPILDTGQ